MTTDRDARSRRRYRLAFLATAMLMLGIVVTLPFSLASVVDDVLGPSGRVIPLLRVEAADVAPAHSRLHLALTQVDEVQLFATLRVSGHRICGAGCTWRDRLLLVSLAPDDDDAEGLPPSASILLPEASEVVTAMVQLPVTGAPIRYPFDRYRLVLAVALQRLHPDGRVETLGPDETRRHLLLTVQELLPRKRMAAPESLDPATLELPGNPVRFAAAYALVVQRPTYLRVLAVLLVLLIAAAASYSVFLRPLEDLIVNSGALVLGVWGIRAILTPGNLFYMTAVDLSLSLVILFLLGGIVVKALFFAHDRGELRVLRRPARPPRGSAHG
jgi:hypothetical protein